MEKPQLILDEQERSALDEWIESGAGMTVNGIDCGLYSVLKNLINHEIELDDCPLETLERIHELFILEREFWLSAVRPLTAVNCSFWNLYINYTKQCIAYKKNQSSFYPAHSDKKTESISLRLYAEESELICLQFFPLCPSHKKDILWEDWHCYRSVLTIYRTDYDRLLLPYLNLLFPLTDPIDGQIQEFFDVCFDNWIDKNTWVQLIGSIKADWTSKTENEQIFYTRMFHWLEEALRETDVIVVWGNQ